MGLKKFLLTGATAGLGLAAIAILPAAAQSNQEEITVTPPTSVQPLRQRMKGGMNAQAISINRYVSTEGLDLSKPLDQDRLRNRVNGTAREACNELDAKFPQTVYVPIDSNQDCVARAAQGALAMANISNNTDEGGEGGVLE